ncbi:non-specific lipid transfer protein GPI-anchored 5-like [Zingiber officinale]|uniref:non-specific lipid transfer protein GPI-anchored 5-like n=1 Tax=Zingiber officinale TaxID=94328 RepID=UPI001C4AA92B|nr:non-specific lipid transfer protein GPI-anchored 5-like [Zingiber officinale]
MRPRIHRTPATTKIDMADQKTAAFSCSCLAMAAAMCMLLGMASAQSSCTREIISLAPCLNYISGNASTPSSSCCSQLARVVQSQPACLCSVLDGGASSLGVTVNQTRALAMPGACGVQTPPASECNDGAGSPAAPNTAPETPSSTPSPPAAGGGSKATPVTTSKAVSYKPTGSLFVSVLLAFFSCLLQ